MPRRGIPPDRRIPFRTWWEKVVLSFQGCTITRGDLILTVAEKDGVVHVDRKLDHAYDLLTRLNGLGWQSTPDGAALYIPLAHQAPPPGVEFLGPAAGPESASVRQIAFEVLATLGDRFPSELGRTTPIQTA